MLAFDTPALTHCVSSLGHKDPLLVCYLVYLGRTSAAAGCELIVSSLVRSPHDLSTIIFLTMPVALDDRISQGMEKKIR